MLTWSSEAGTWIPISLRSIDLDIPVVEYRPFRDFSAHQATSLLVQLGVGDRHPHPRRRPPPFHRRPAEPRERLLGPRQVPLRLEALPVKTVPPLSAGLALALLSAAALPSCNVSNRHARRADTVVGKADLDVDLPSIQAKLDRLTGAKRTLNKVTLLHLGRTSRPERIRLIEGAERTVFQTVPYWFDDEEGRFFRDLIRTKREKTPGIDVRLLLDWSSPGSTGDLFGTKMFASLREVTGGNALLWNEPQWQRRFSADLLRNRMHEKLLVVDGEKLVMGGMNVADDYLQGGVTRKGWHDTDLLVEGPAAAEAQKVFLKLWELSKYLDSPAPFPAFQEPETKVLQKLFYQDDGRFQVRPIAEGGKQPKLVDAEIPFRKYLGDPRTFPELAPRPEWTDAPPLHLRQHPRRPQPAHGAAGLEDHGHPRLPDPDVPLVRPPLRPVPDAARGLPRRAREGRQGRQVRRHRHELRAEPRHRDDPVESRDRPLPEAHRRRRPPLRVAGARRPPRDREGARLHHSGRPVARPDDPLQGRRRRRPGLPRRLAQLQREERVVQQRVRRPLPGRRDREAAREGLRRRPRPRRVAAHGPVRRRRSTRGRAA